MEWQRKGATLSDKTARQEFGLAQDEIYDAIDAGTLQYRQAYMHGNPWLRLFRREVEALARARHGGPLRQRAAGQGRADACQPRDQAPADRTGRTRGAASQARLRSRKTARRRILPHVMQADLHDHDLTDGQRTCAPGHALGMLR
jgi:hypothetical protein